MRDADPALAEELELFGDLMDAGTRERFWHAFAEERERVDRPAQAVLPALERAAALLAAHPWVGAVHGDAEISVRPATAATGWSFCPRASAP